MVALTSRTCRVPRYRVQGDWCRFRAAQKEVTQRIVMHAANVSDSGRMGDFMSGRLPPIGDSVERRRQELPTDRQRQQQFQRVTGKANMVRWTMPAPNREKFRYQPPTTDRLTATPRMSPAVSAPDQYIEWQKAKVGRGKGNPFNYRWSPPQKRSALSVRLSTLESSIHTPRRGAASDGDTRDTPMVRLGTYELIGPTPTMIATQVLHTTPATTRQRVSVQNFEMPQLCRADVADARWGGADALNQPAKVVCKTRQEEDLSRQQKASVVTLSLQKTSPRVLERKREPLRQISTDDPASCLSDPGGPTRSTLMSLTHSQAKDSSGRFLGRFNKLDVFSERGCRINVMSPVSSPYNGGDTTRRPLAPPPTFRTSESVTGSQQLHQQQQQQQQQYGAMVGRKLHRKTTTMLVGRSDSNELSYAFAGQRGCERSVDDLIAGNAATLCGQRYGQTAAFGSKPETPRAKGERKQTHLQPVAASSVTVDESADLCRWARAAIAAHNNDDDMDDDAFMPSPINGVMTASHGDGE